MMISPRASSNFLLSLIAFAGSLVVVLAEGHIQIDATNPATWMELVNHKCGCVMLACFCWVVTEGVKSIFYPVEVEWGARRAFRGRVLQ